MELARCFNAPGLLATATLRVLPANPSMGLDNVRRGLADPSVTGTMLGTHRAMVENRRGTSGSIRTPATQLWAQTTVAVQRASVVTNSLFGIILVIAGRWRSVTFNAQVCVRETRTHTQRRRPPYFHFKFHTAHHQMQAMLLCGCLLRVNCAVPAAPYACSNFCASFIQAGSLLFTLVLFSLRTQKHPLRLPSRLH